MSIIVDVQFAVTNRDGLPTKKQVSNWVKVALEGFMEQAEVTIRIVEEEEGKSLNERWRKNKTGATNVLSFPAGEDAFGNPGFLGDVIICAPVVIREAIEQDKQTSAHWAHMVVHGILHLLGYDHETNVDAVEMESLEIKKLGELGFENPYN